MKNFFFFEIKIYNKKTNEEMALEELSKEL